MTSDWLELADRQGGLVTRGQLAAAGVTERALRGGTELVKVRHGVYARSASWDSADDAGRTALRVRAERLCTRRDLVAVGRTAALVHGLPVLRRPDRLDVVERKQVRPDHHGRSRLVVEADVEEVLGVPVTCQARTAVDVARSGFAAGVVTADAVLRRGVDREDLELAVDLSRRWPGRLTALDVVAFADPLAETALESLGRARFHQHGLPPPASQVWLGDAGGLFARVDHYWAEHRTVAEADGALKYVDAATLFAEKRREDRLRDAGFEVVRYTWDEVLRRPVVVVRRIERAFARAGRRAA